MSESATTAAVPAQGAAAAGPPDDNDALTPLDRALVLLRAAAPNALDDDARTVWDVQRALLFADLGLPPVERRSGPRRITR